MITRKSIALLALITTAIVGCGESPTQAGGEVGPSLKAYCDPNEFPDRRLDLIRPELSIAEKGEGGYVISFRGAAAGGADSPEIKALMSVRSVDFEVRRANTSLVRSFSTEVTVHNAGCGQLLPVVLLAARADVEWDGVARRGDYVVMIVRGTNGFASRQELIPITIDREDVAGTSKDFGGRAIPQSTRSISVK